MIAFSSPRGAARPRFEQLLLELGAEVDRRADAKRAVRRLRSPAAMSMSANIWLSNSSTALRSVKDPPDRNRDVLHLGAQIVGLGSSGA